ncbi:class I SAM-dependent methyltransferase [Sinimarinibacterium flocculans]|uniref:class I SAM-dependent methyltransferase n=1 Tax=Sinimarinibacterium flocculans TaxID=985250 RepID=UPI000D7644A4|nr:class I SAM-dependent methyltransferase [Sinimarinibacterium flocculans]
MASSRLRRFVDSLRHTPLHPQWLLSDRRIVTGKLRTLGSGHILDIGCADRWVEAKLPAGCEDTGIDYFVTGSLMYGASPDAFADAAALPLRDASVDAVVILEVIEHLPSPRQALHEIARVLRPGGQLLLSVPFLYPIHDAPYDFQRFTEHGLAHEIELAGMRVCELRPSLGAVQTAGLIVCLALGGMAAESVRRRSLGVLLFPFAALAVSIINVTAWVAGKLLPGWTAVTAGYVAVARKS